jgi:DNA-binding transcriptional regulator YdaS (Cro superfamily)
MLWQTSRMDEKTFHAALGNPQQLAEAIGSTRDMIYVWRQRRTVPAKWVAKVEAATGVPAYEMRPDIFMRPKRKISA